MSRCVERCFAEDERHDPVKLIIFDLDETLTMTTFMSPDGQYTEEQHEWAAMVNFESPWVEGSRIEKLKRLFTELKEGDCEGEGRALAVLTRNSNPSGVRAVLNLLAVAGLRDYFSAVWTMPWRKDMENGAYQEAGEWKFFDPPIQRLPDHKTSAVRSMAVDPKAWLPQLEDPACEMQDMLELRLENIMLVDDQSSNFQAGNGNRVLRYCKVARYDSEYLDFGMLTGMGGLGAHDDNDYNSLKRFVSEPWKCKEAFNVVCEEIFDGSNIRKLPVDLIIFGFDETLTLATFMPDSDFNTDVNWESHRWQHIDDQWNRKDLIKYNFESPWVKGRRVKKLRKMLERLCKATNAAEERTLVIMARRKGGAVSILNMLKAAKMDKYFSAIWTCPAASDNSPNGVYQAGGKWKAFKPPVSEETVDKSDIIRHVVENTEEWLPQLVGDDFCPERRRKLKSLIQEKVALVDDERLTSGEPLSLRQAYVTRYDELYRDCGLLSQMGGIGAFSDKDYDQLEQFIDAPWNFYCEKPTTKKVAGDKHDRSLLRIPTIQRVSSDEPTSEKSERRRGTTSFFVLGYNSGDTEEEDDAEESGSDRLGRTMSN